jgi:iron complex transport system substrate-binding protein
MKSSMKGNVFILAVFAALAPLLAIAGGCKKENAATAGTSAANVPEAAQDAIPGRIISAAPSNTEIIVGLGLADRLIAVDRYSKDIAGVKPDLPEIDFFYPDAEAVIGLSPDIIISNEINNFGAADSPFKPLVDVGIKVVQIPTSTSVQGIYDDIVAVAEALGVKERGQELAGALKAEVDQIAEIGKTVRDKRNVYFEVSPMPYLVTLGSGTYLNEMIELLGGVNIFSDQSGWFAPSAEAILERDPDVILTMEMTGPDTADPVGELKSREGFETITAVKENRIYAINANSSGRPSQNIMLAFWQMARAVYPELYGAD